MDTLVESAPDPRLQGPHERPGEGQGQITELVACPGVRIAGDTANAPSEHTDVPVGGSHWRVFCLQGPAEVFVHRNSGDITQSPGLRSGEDTSSLRN